MTALAKAIRLLERGDWDAAHRLVQDDEPDLGFWRTIGRSV